MKAEENKNSLVPIYLILVAIILIWGFSWPISKIGLQYIPPMWFTAFRILIGTICMFFIVILMKKFTLPTRRAIPLIAVMGLIQIATFMTLINLGLQYVDAGRSAILAYTTPLWVIPLAVFFFDERTSWQKWLGFLLGLTGILILFTPWEVDWKNHAELFGNGLLLLAALSWAVCMLCARHMHWHHSPLELISWQLLLANVPVWIMALLLEPHPAIILNWSLIFCLLYLGIFATALAYLGTMIVSKELPSVTISLCFLAVPITGLISSAYMLNEVITLSIFTAMIFILGGIVCVALSKSK